MQTASWFRGRKGWFSEREEKIIVNKVLIDDFAKAEMHNREAITPKTLFQAIKSWQMYPLYIIGLLFEISKTPPTTYLTLILRILWFSTVKTNLLTLPSKFIHMFLLLFLNYLSALLDEQSLVSLIG